MVEGPNRVPPVAVTGLFGVGRTGAQLYLDQPVLVVVSGHIQGTLYIYPPRKMIVGKRFRLTFAQR